MRIVRRVIGFLVVMAMLLPMLAFPGSLGAQGTVLDQQVIEIEGMRPIGLSPDGNLLAAANTGGRSLCVYRVKPFEEQVCTDLEQLEAGLRIEDVSWSPDSTRLVMAENSFMYFRDGDLWIMDAASGELTNLTDDGFQGNVPLLEAESEAELFFDVSPAWTPDGSQVTFARSAWVDGDFQGTQIMTVPADGGEATELLLLDMSMPGIAYQRMQWSSDGQFLYYTITYPQMDDFRNGIYRFSPADGTINGIVPSDPDLGPPALLQVSPAGDALIGIYPVMRVDPMADGHFFFDLETEERTMLVAPESDEEPRAIPGAVTFSPDGRSILLGVRLGADAGTVWELSRDDLSAELLADDLPGVAVMGYGMIPTWTASGRIFVPANIGIGTLLEVAPRDIPSSTSAPSASPEAEDRGFAAGDTVVVASVGVPLHAAPASTAPAVLLLGEGAALTVIGEAVEVDGVVWIPVRDEATQSLGYVRAEQVNT